MIRTVTLPPRSKISERGKTDICSGQFLTHVEITPHVLFSKTSPRDQSPSSNGPSALSNPVGPQKESLASCLEPTSICSHLPGPSTQSERVIFLEASFSGAKTTSEVTPPSDTKTLQSLPIPLWLLLGDMTLVIHGFDHVARLSSCSKCYNTLTSIRVVMDSSEYLCMAILDQAAQSCGYKKIVTCKSCSCGDPMYPYTQWQPWQV